MSTSDRSPVPTHIPDELQHHYAAGARRQVHATRGGRLRRARARGDDPRSASRRSPVPIVLGLTTVILAAAFGIAASSWLIGVVMLVVLAALVAFGVGVHKLVRSKGPGDTR